MLQAITCTAATTTPGRQKQHNNNQPSTKIDNVVVSPTAKKTPQGKANEAQQQQEEGCNDEGKGQGEAEEDKS